MPEATFLATPKGDGTTATSTARHEETILGSSNTIRVTAIYEDVDVVVFIYLVWLYLIYINYIHFMKM